MAGTKKVTHDGYNDPMEVPLAHLSSVRRASFRPSHVRAARICGIGQSRVPPGDATTNNAVMLEQVIVKELARRRGKSVGVGDDVCLHFRMICSVGRVDRRSGDRYRAGRCKWCESSYEYQAEGEPWAARSCVSVPVAYVPQR